MNEVKPKLALVVGTVPSVEEIDQFRLLADRYDIKVLTSESIAAYILQNSRFQDLTLVTLPDYDENPSYMPGLESCLKGFDVVIAKERLGLYAYQTLKAKVRNGFKFLVWIDNLLPYPANDLDQMRTVRNEVTRGADGFIVQSNAARLALQLEGVADERILDMVPWTEHRVTRDPKSRAAALKSLGLPETQTIIGYIGPIEWEEGLAELAPTLKALVTKKPTLREKLKVIFCGVGSYAGELRDAFVAMGVEDMSLYLAPNRAAVDALLTVADAIYVGTMPSHDRIDGEPYRILQAMTHEIPLLASRSALVEEFCGKHRIDFCPGSLESLITAVGKITDARALKNDVVKKNLADVQNRFTPEKARISMDKIFQSILKASTLRNSDVERLVADAEAKVKDQQYLAAIDIIEAVFQRDDIPAHMRSNLYRMVGDSFAKLGDFDAAKIAYMQSAELDPYAPRPFIGLGTVSLLRQSYEIAVLNFQKAVGLAPDDEMANLGLGLAFQGLREFKEATRWIRKSLEIKPDNAAAIFAMVQVAHESELYDDAEKVLRNYLLLMPNDANMMFTLAALLFKQGKYAEAGTQVEGLLAINGTDKRAIDLQAQIRAARDAKATTSNA